MDIQKVGWEAWTGFMWLWTGIDGGLALVNAVTNFRVP